MATVELIAKLETRRERRRVVGKVGLYISVKGDFNLDSMGTRIMVVYICA
jgi:hypothetical protein